MSVKKLAPHLEDCIKHADALDKSHPLTESHTHTGNGLIVLPFLEAVAHDERFGTFHAACADEFNELTVALRDYFNLLQSAAMREEPA